MAFGQSMNKEHGFTLLEVVISLVLLGILTVFAGMAISTGVKAYIFARENAALVQKIQLAMTRISRELLEMSTVVYADGDKITFDSINGETYTIQKVDKGIYLKDSNSTEPGSPLIENIANYDAGESFLSFMKADKSPWTTEDDFGELFMIEIFLKVARSSGSEGTDNLILTAIVNPRNNGIINSPGVN
ncbi:PulJ/GspJ family protein [Desulfovulcanus sp.]